MSYFQMCLQLCKIAQNNGMFFAHILKLLYVCLWRVKTGQAALPIHLNENAAFIIIIILKVNMNIGDPFGAYTAPIRRLAVGKMSWRKD